MEGSEGHYSEGHYIDRWNGSDSEGRGLIVQGRCNDSRRVL